MTIRPPPPSGMYEVPDGGSTLAAEPRKVIRQAWQDSVSMVTGSKPQSRLAGSLQTKERVRFSHRLLWVGQGGFVPLDLRQSG